MDLDLGVCARKGGEGVLEKGVHAAGGTGPVAVMKVEAFTLKNEGAKAVLQAGIIREAG